MAWAGKDEEELTDAVESAEESTDFATIVGIMTHAAGAEDPEDLMAVAELTCDVLFRCTKPGSDSATSAGEVGACESVSLILTTYVEEAALMEVCLGCIRNLALSGGSNLEKLAGCASGIVKAMSEHAASNEPTLQEQVFKLDLQSGC